MPFDLIIIALYIIGVVASGAFVVSWTPLAVKALAQGRQGVSLLRILDFAGLQFAVLLSFLLILRTAHLYGIQAPADGLSAVGRLALPLMIDILVCLRLARWMRQLWIHRESRPNTPPDPLAQARRRDESSP